MIDEAFLPFRELLAGMLALPGELVDAEAGVRSRIYECELESPVELDVVRDESGRLELGSVPPLYRVDTDIRPSFHRLRVTMVVEENGDGS
jgi:hypothetical protein